ncbi:MAG: tRNA (adenosine(37)-N6)-threonylcarbamoyltransferase complex dimerization subunit type 1 TsaB, partial [Gammaproteobacteria bacterium]|nr:tRNA (adenosine(37)-N6)-threonylcarbamoyltransferase complex dimerization subunit type 1 TsaB [Gammaproteobacteria bacterium]
MKDVPAVLALETSTEVCSAALAAGGRIGERTLTVPREHTRHILGQVDELLGEAGLAAADLEAVAFGRGPGTFTGVRVATALAQGLAVAHGPPRLPVTSLAALAGGAWREPPVAPRPGPPRPRPH